MMKNQKNFVIVVFMVVFITSVLSVSSMVKNVRNNSFESFAQGSECRTQGVFMPEPFEDTLVAPIEVEEEEVLFAQAGDIKPRTWDEEDSNGTAGD
jgi:hypothetical protein